jgi:hypothetical protein
VVQNLVPSFGEYELLADITVSTATSTVGITGLNIDKDDEILLVADIYNPSPGTSTYRLFANNDTTTTNYYSQSLQANSTTVSAARGNVATLSSIPNFRGLAMAYIKLTNSGYVTFQSKTMYDYGGSSLVLYDSYATSTFTATSITQLTVSSSAANAIGIGSRFQLYRTGGA